MKILALAAAAGLVATAMIPTAASADRHHGHGWTWKNVCKTTWSHGHKHRECHKVRTHW